MQTSETLNSPPAPTVAGDATENRPTTPSAVPLAKPSSAEVLITEVLITEQQVIARNGLRPLEPAPPRSSTAS